MDIDIKAELSSENILVTGGAGFIGSHLVGQLAETGARIKVLDNFDDFYPGKQQNLARFNRYENVELITGSILDLDIMKTLCHWSTLVFHEAGQAGIRYCNRHPEKAHEINVAGTLNLLIAARDNPPRRIVNASSSSVYGDIEDLPINERVTKKPGSLYAATKLAAEKYCEAYHRAYALDVVSLRYFSVYGPSQRPDLVITTFANNLLNGITPKIFGDGTHSRDFTYISDIVDGTIRAALAKDVDGMAFNLGKGERTTVDELLRLLKELMGKEEVEPIHTPEFPGEFPHTQADISLARRYLGYSPRVSLREGLRMYLKWFLGVRKKNSNLEE